MSQPDRLTQLNRLLTKSPDEKYEQIAKRLREARLVFHECVVEQVSHPLNKKLEAMPHASYSEKCATAAFLNGECRALGIAIKCPVSNEEVTLAVGDANDPNGGRYRLRPYNDRNSRTFSSTKIFPMNFAARFERAERKHGDNTLGR